MDRTRADIRASLALRPDSSPWIVANRLDWVVLDEQGPSTRNEEWRIIDNLHVNRRFGRFTQATIQYGGKYIDITAVGDLDVEFQGAPSVRLINAEAHSGNYRTE